MADDAAFQGDATWQRARARENARDAEKQEVRLRHDADKMRRARLRAEEFERQLRRGTKRATDLKVAQIRARLQSSTAPAAGTGRQGARAW